AGLKPIVELGFMPEALSSDPERSGDWHAANVAPPKDYMRWRNLIYETVKHLQQRYGAKEIETWYFEVWNEPDLWYHFWVEDPHNPGLTNLSEYYKLYDYAVDGALAANPNVKVGGPAVAGWDYVFEGFLRHTVSGVNHVTSTKGTPIDFFSFHKYGDIEENILDNIKLLVSKALAVDKKKFSSMPFLLDEFGPTTRSLEPWKNTSYVAAWVCQLIDALFELGYKKGAVFRPEVMVFWASVGENYQDGEGILATIVGNDPENIVKGPVFNAYDMLSYLGHERLLWKGTNFGDEVHGIATKHPDQSVEILIYRINDRYSLTEDSVEVKLVVSPLPFEKCLVKYFSIDETHSNGYSLWKNMARPTDPTPEQIAILQTGDDLELFEPISQQDITAGVYSKILKLPPNSVTLLVLSKITDAIPPNAPAKLRAQHITTNSISLTWEPPLPASDGDIASSYHIYRDQLLLTKSLKNSYIDSDLLDNTRYSYSIFAVDDEGNVSESAIQESFTTLPDKSPPRLLSITTPDDSTVVIFFDEPIAELSAVNFTINNGVKVKQARLDGDGQTVSLHTTPHVKGTNYVLEVTNIRDKAREPNLLWHGRYDYTFVLKFSDTFNLNRLFEYTWQHIGNTLERASYLFDEENLRLQILTGDNIGIQFSHRVSESTRGSFSIKFLPVKKYPDGGMITIKLKADEQNYYQLTNTDGYGPGKLEKYIDGLVVDSVKFESEYSQKNLYQLNLHFTPQWVSVEAFAQTLTLSDNNTAIGVREFEITVTQQDAFFDDIIFESL
ncbi:MAG: hypothetical protein ONB05_08390, partial [candidate division KSB1 bacterium]|nr:hypothetical protein [candidate division KSB1 bacterium]